MKYLLGILAIIILVVLFFSSITHIFEYGSSGIIITGLIGYVLYKIFKAIYDGYKEGGNNSSSSYAHRRPPTYTGGGASKEDDEIDEMVMLDMMDGDLDGKFDFLDED